MGRKFPVLPIIVLMLAASIIHVMIYEINLTGARLAPSLPEGKLTMAQAKSIDTVLDLSYLMLGWAIAIIGATAFFIRLNIEKDISLKRTDLFTSSIIAILSVISLHYGHLGVYQIAEMLSLNQYPVGNAVIREIFGRQYLAALGATGLFGVHVILLCWRLMRR